MILLILALIVSLVPAVLLYRRMKRRKKDDEAYKALCGSALKNGFLCVIPVVLVSGVFQLIIRLTSESDL